jgi:hypothetical protein
MVRAGRAALVPLVLLATSSLFAPPAKADLVSIDLASAGDGLVTRDTVNGLEWLDLPLTAGQSVSYWLGNNCGGVPECPPGGWFNNGWRMANGPEVCNLFAQFDSFQPIPPCPDDYEYLANGAGWQILGVNCHHSATGAPIRIEAFYDDGDPINRVGYAFMMNAFRITDDDRDTWSYSGTPCNATLDQGIATFFVRQGPLPEPDPDPPPVRVPGLGPIGAVLLAGLLFVSFVRARRTPGAGFAGPSESKLIDWR